MLSVPSMEEDSEFDINIARVPGVDVTCSDPTVFNKISDSISSERSEDPNGTGARKEQRDLHACPKGDTLKKLCRQVVLQFTNEMQSSFSLWHMQIRLIIFNEGTSAGTVLSTFRFFVPFPKYPAIMSSVQMYYGVKCKRTAMELYEFYFKQLYNYVVRSKNG